MRTRENGTKPLFVIIMYYLSGAVALRERFFRKTSNKKRERVKNVRRGDGVKECDDGYSI